MRGSFGDELAPAGSVGGKKLPGLSADIEVFQGNFQTVLVVPINCGLVKSEFPVKELLLEWGPLGCGRRDLPISAGPCA